MAQMAAEVRGHVRGRLIPALLVLLQRLGDDRLDIAPQRPLDRAQARRLGVGDRAGGIGQRSLAQLVRQLAGEGLVADDPQRVDVASRVDLVGRARGLLRAHVLQCADQLADRRLQRTAHEVAIGGPGHAEVEDPWLAVRVDQDVSGLEVAMDDALRVGVMDAVTHLGQQLQPPLDRQLVLADIVGERAAFHQLHHQERLGAGPEVRRPGVVDAGDVGMVELPQQLRFVPEPAERRRGEEARTKDLHRDLAAGPVLVGLEDGGGASAAHRPPHAVGPDGFG